MLAFIDGSLHSILSHSAALHMHQSFHIRSFQSTNPQIGHSFFRSSHSDSIIIGADQSSLAAPLPSTCYITVIRSLLPSSTILFLGLSNGCVAIFNTSRSHLMQLLAPSSSASFSDPIAILQIDHIHMWTGHESGTIALWSLKDFPVKDIALVNTFNRAKHNVWGKVEQGFVCDGLFYALFEDGRVRMWLSKTGDLVSEMGPGNERSLLNLSIDHRSRLTDSERRFHLFAVDCNQLIGITSDHCLEWIGFATENRLIARLDNRGLGTILFIDIWRSTHFVLLQRASKRPVREHKTYQHDESTTPNRYIIQIWQVYAFSDNSNVSSRLQKASETVLDKLDKRIVDVQIDHKNDTYLLLTNQGTLVTYNLHDLMRMGCVTLEHMSRSTLSFASLTDAELASNDSSMDTESMSSEVNDTELVAFDTMTYNASPAHSNCSKTTVAETIMDATQLDCQPPLKIDSAALRVFPEALSIMTPRSSTSPCHLKYPDIGHVMTAEQLYKWGYLSLLGTALKSTHETYTNIQHDLFSFNKYMTALEKEQEKSIHEQYAELCKFVHFKAKVCHIMGPLQQRERDDVWDSDYECEDDDTSRWWRLHKSFQPVHPDSASFESVSEPSFVTCQTTIDGSSAMSVSLPKTIVKKPSRVELTAQRKQSSIAAALRSLETKTIAILSDVNQHVQSPISDACLDDLSNVGWSGQLQPDKETGFHPLTPVHDHPMNHLQGDNVLDEMDISSNLKQRVQQKETTSIADLLAETFQNEQSCKVVSDDCYIRSHRISSPATFLKKRDSAYQSAMNVANDTKTVPEISNKSIADPAVLLHGTRSHVQRKRSHIAMPSNVTNLIEHIESLLPSESLVSGIEEATSSASNHDASSLESNKTAVTLETWGFIPEWLRRKPQTHTQS